MNSRTPRTSYQHISTEYETTFHWCKLSDSQLGLTQLCSWQNKLILMGVKQRNNHLHFH